MVKKFMTTAEDWARQDQKIKTEKESSARARIAQFKIDNGKDDEWEREILDCLFGQEDVPHVVSTKAYWKKKKSG